MMKPNLPIGLTLFLVATLAAQAQTPVQDTAVNEAVMRQAYRISLRQKLTDAHDAQTRHDLPQAAQLYDEAWDLVQKSGGDTLPEADQTRTGLAAVRLELARTAQKHANYKEAGVNVSDVLRVDPSNADALAFQHANDKLLQEQKGKIPDPETQGQVPKMLDDKAHASTLVHDGQLLFEMGQMDQAEAKLKEAKKLDPQNQAIYYYLNLITEARFKKALQERDVTSRQSLVEIEKAWNNPPNRDLLPIPNPYNRTNLVHTSKGRQIIYSKLDRIHLDNVKYERLPLSEVILNLNDEARRRDPEKRGINFIFNQNVDTGGAAATGAAGAVDPTTGLPVQPTAPAEQVDMSQIIIQIVPPLNDVSLANVLDAICKVADKPIKYSVEDYAVVFSLKGHDPSPLYFRTFKVDPNTFEQGLQSVISLDFGAIAQAQNSGGGGGGGGASGGGASGISGGGGGGQGGGLSPVPRVAIAGGAGGGGGLGGGGGGGGLRAVTRTNDMTFAQLMAERFFATLITDFSPQAGEAVFFNDREGSLLVRATLLHLDIIEAAVQTLNIAPPQVNIKTKFVAISQNDSRALGFDWYLGNFLMGGGAISAMGGTAPSFNGQPTAANPQGFFPGTSPGTTIPSSPSDQFITSGLRNPLNAPALGTVSGILTDPQFRVVIKALEQRDGADLLNESSVTTLSGRQTEIQVVDLQTIVIGTSLNQTSGGGGGNFGATAPGVIGSTVNYPTQTLPFGPTLDVVPYVSADGFTIQMTLIPTITEFLQYDDPGKFVPQAQSASSGSGGVALPITAQLPLPRFRVRQVTTSAIVWDGQTVVLGGLISENVTKQKDSIPVLGDLPVVGRLFRSESSQTQKQNLMIFVTPTIIDPAGNRAHSEDEMPFAQNAIPVQTATRPAAQ